MNKVILGGYISRDIETRYTPTANKAVVSFDIACRNGKDTTFIKCVAWEKNAEFISKYFKKGSYIEIVGRMQNRYYDDKDGKRVYITEVLVEEVFFGGNSKKQEGQDLFTPVTDEDLPF